MTSIETDGVPSNGSKTFGPIVDWSELLDRVKTNEVGAGEELYSLISKGMLFFLRRQMPMHLAEERMHDAFLIVLKAIQDGRIENANAFLGYVRTVTKRQFFNHLHTSVNSPECSDDLVAYTFPANAKYNPDSILDSQQRSILMARVLKSMDPKRREILKRFYVLEQTQDQICTEMKLTDIQFRLLKNRAKAEFGERGRKMMTPKKPLQVDIPSRRFSVYDFTRGATA
jgi:RNA polymerase sigma factor (sigma-70 family)